MLILTTKKKALWTSWQKTFSPHNTFGADQTFTKRTPEKQQRIGHLHKLTELKDKYYGNWKKAIQANYEDETRSETDIL